jgi:hypothetical protein
MPLKTNNGFVNLTGSLIENKSALRAFDLLKLTYFLINGQATADPP